MTGGQELTKPEYCALLDKAGFVLNESCRLISSEHRRSLRRVSRPDCARRLRCIFARDNASAQTAAYPSIASRARRIAVMEELGHFRTKASVSGASTKPFSSDPDSDTLSLNQRGGAFPHPWGAASLREGRIIGPNVSYQ